MNIELTLFIILTITCYTLYRVVKLQLELKAERRAERMAELMRIYSRKSEHHEYD
jgi:hypothetical protein